MKHENMEKEFFHLVSEDKKLEESMKELILAALKANGGRITFIHENENDEYPVTATLWGKYDYPLIDITDVYLSEKGAEIYADGINNATGCIETGFEIYPEQYSDILYFIASVLEWKQKGNEEKQPGTGPFEVTILFGSDVICEYKDTGEFPSETWLEANGGVIDTKTFETEEQMKYYLKGVNDADGWLECLVLDDFMKNLIEEERKLLNKNN